LEEEKEHMGQRWFEQEYMCRFTDDSRRRFSSEMVRRALVDVPGLQI
jgi:hypothetical protein